MADDLAALRDALAEYRSVASNLTDAQVDQLGLFAVEVAKSDPVALALLDIVSAVLSAYEEAKRM